MAVKEINGIRNFQRKTRKHLLSDTVIVIIFPVLSAITEKMLTHVTSDWMLFGKWFVFWCFGFRLFTSGIKQASDPLTRLTKINTANNEFYEMVRELGIANICLGVGGILSLINDTWRQIIAILGCLFFGLDTVRCLTTTLSSVNQKLMLLFNLIVFTILFLCILFAFKRF